jgi:hypothetical protein
LVQLISGMNRALAALVGLAVAIVGIACMLRPASIRNYELRMKWTPFAKWKQRPSYLVYLRFMGILALLWAALVIVIAISHS